MNSLFGRYQVAPIFYAGLVWLIIGLFTKHHTTFLILGLLFMGMGLKRPEPTPPAEKQPDARPEE